MNIINTKTICKTLLKVFAIAFFAQAAYAEVTLKLGTTGRLGMPIGDAIDQALIPALAKASDDRLNHKRTQSNNSSIFACNRLQVN